MNQSRQEEIDYLWDMQKATQLAVQEIANRMATMAEDRARGVVVTSETWDQILASWNHVHQQMQDFGVALSKRHTP